MDLWVSMRNCLVFFFFFISALIHSLSSEGTVMTNTRDPFNVAPDRKHDWCFQKHAYKHFSIVFVPPITLSLHISSRETEKPFIFHVTFRQPVSGGQLRYATINQTVQKQMRYLSNRGFTRVLIWPHSRKHRPSLCSHVKYTGFCSSSPAQILTDESELRALHLQRYRKSSSSPTHVAGQRLYP